MVSLRLTLNVVCWGALVLMTRPTRPPGHHGSHRKGVSSVKTNTHVSRRCDNCIHWDRLDDNHGSCRRDATAVLSRETKDCEWCVAGYEPRYVDYGETLNIPILYSSPGDYHEDVFGFPVLDAQCRNKAAQEILESSIITERDLIYEFWSSWFSDDIDEK